MNRRRREPSAHLFFPSLFYQSRAIPPTVRDAAGERSPTFPGFPLKTFAGEAAGVTAPAALLFVKKFLFSFNVTLMFFAYIIANKTKHRLTRGE